MIKAGDRVTLQTLPPWVEQLPEESQQVFRLCVGQTLTVSSIDAHGNLELDASALADGHNGGFMNTIFVEPIYVREPLRGTPKTLLLTLRARAIEHARPDGLFRDPTAADWSARLPWDAEYEALLTPTRQTGFAVRTRVYDEVAARFLDSHPGARVVELGAGLSTRWQRIGQGRAHRAEWVEIDLPEVITLRRELEGESEGHRTIARSLFDHTWMDTLPEAASEDSLFIAEGVLVFLPEAEVRAVVVAMRRRFPGATFLLDAGGGALETRSGPPFAAAGAPMQWFVRGESEVAALGLDLRHVWPMLTQYPERWGRAPSGELPVEFRLSGLMIEALILP